MGQPMEHVLRQSLIALRLAEYLGLAEPDRAVAYYLSLLARAACHVAAYEQAKWSGDDLARSYPADMRGPPTWRSANRCRSYSAVWSTFLASCHSRALAR